MNGIVPEGYSTLREAAYAIAEVQYAGLNAHDAVVKVRAAGSDVRYTSEELEESTKKLWQLIDETHGRRERLDPVYVWAEQPTTGRMIRIEPGKLAAVPHARKYKGGTLEYLRPGSATFIQFARRFRPPFHDVDLMLRTKDVRRLARKMREVVRRTPKPPKSERKVGRPDKQSAIRGAIMDLHTRRKWAARHDSLGQLVYLLGRPPYEITASESTIRRALKKLVHEEGLDCLQRPQKQRPTA